MMTVRLFAAARDAAGADAISLPLSAGATVGDLRQALYQAVPALDRWRGSLWIAVNNDYAADTAVIPLGAEVACFPPVSGG